MRCIFSFLAVAIVVLILGTAGRTAAQEEGLVLYLSFDEGAGDTARDSSGHGNNGEINGPKWVEGADGKALEFDGVDDYVEVPYNDMFNINDAMTLAAWVKPAMARDNKRSEVNSRALSPSDERCKWRDRRLVRWYLGMAGYCCYT